MWLGILFMAGLLFLGIFILFLLIMIIADFSTTEEKDSNKLLEWNEFQKEKNNLYESTKKIENAIEARELVSKNVYAILYKKHHDKHFDRISSQMKKLYENKINIMYGDVLTIINDHAIKGEDSAKILYHSKEKRDNYIIKWCCSCPFCKEDYRTLDNAWLEYVIDKVVILLKDKNFEAYRQEFSLFIYWKK